MLINPDASFSVSLMVAFVALGCTPTVDPRALPIDAGSELDSGVNIDASCEIERASSDGTLVPDTASAVHDALLRVMTDRPIAGLAVAVSRGAELRYSEGLGLARPADGLSATPATPFLLASISKTVIAVAIMQLVSAGSIDLDVDIDTYLSALGVRVRNPNFPNVRITTRMLLTHTSTLWDVRHTYDATWYVRGDSPISAAEFVAGYFNPESPYYGGADSWWDSEPGTLHCYSNMGVAVLGVIIEQVSGLSLAEYTRERIFRPLGMSRTSWRLAEYCSPDEIARGVQWDGSQFVDDDNGTQGQPEGHPEIASGMLRTTSSDFIRFAMAIGNGGELDGARILASATVEEMLTRQLGPEVATCPDGRSDASRQAMLWHRIQDRFGNDWAGHYGGVNGASTALWLVPGDAVRYVILTNQAGIETVGAVEAALLANITPLLE